MKLTAKITLLFLILATVVLTVRTASAQTTGCGQFQDVPQGSTFYPYIFALSCQQVVDGYPCDTTNEKICVPPANLPYFLPGNDVSRGQMMKMIVVGAKYTDSIPATQQTFSDVLPNSTFWKYIETAYAHQVITGYPCGGTDETCDAQHRPYFRPGAPMSRGQAAKVVVVSAGILTTDIPTTATFADVPVGSTFFSYIEAAYAHQLITGYACGGTGETCNSDHQPYFRPAANLSRGQASKISALAFNFPIPTQGACALLSSGDTNCDGVVNMVDYLYYVRHEQSAPIPSSVNLDVDGNGSINGDDRTVIVNNINSSRIQN